MRSSRSRASSPITGPMSVDGVGRIAEPQPRPARRTDASISASGRLLRHVKGARSAEQRWPAEPNAEAMTSSIDLLLEGGGVDEHAVQPAGLGE